MKGYTVFPPFSSRSNIFGLLPHARVKLDNLQAVQDAHTNVLGTDNEKFENVKENVARKEREKKFYERLDFVYELMPESSLSVYCYDLIIP